MGCKLSTGFGSRFVVSHTSKHSHVSAAEPVLEHIVLVQVILLSLKGPKFPLTAVKSPSGACGEC